MDGEYISYNLRPRNFQFPRETDQNTVRKKIRRYSESSSESEHVSEEQIKANETEHKKKLYREKITHKINSKSEHLEVSINFFLLFIILIIILGCCFVYNSPLNHQNVMFDIKQEIVTLKKKYPNQSPNLWGNIMKMASENYTSIHTLILMYNDNGNNEGILAECLARDIVRIFIKTHNLSDEIYIYKSKFQDGKDLEYYLDLLTRSRHLIVRNVNEVSGNAAKVFQFLCDESMNVKPSYFIFTLQVNEGSENSGKPGTLYKRAGNILRNSWKNLPENELHSLISRVVRNVVEILPGAVVECL